MGGSASPARLFMQYTMKEGRMKKARIHDKVSIAAQPASAKGVRMKLEYDLTTDGADDGYDSDGHSEAATIAASSPAAHRESIMTRTIEDGDDGERVAEASFKRPRAIPVPSRTQTIDRWVASRSNSATATSQHAAICQSEAPAQLASQLPTIDPSVVVVQQTRPTTGSLRLPAHSTTQTRANPNTKHKKTLTRPKTSKRQSCSEAQVANLQLQNELQRIELDFMKQQLLNKETDEDTNMWRENKMKEEKLLCLLQHKTSQSDGQVDFDVEEARKDVLDQALAFYPCPGL